MFVSGIATFVRSVAMRRLAPCAMPMPPPITTPSMNAMIGLAEAVDQVVEAVFLGEEVLQPRVTGERGLVEEADVAAGAEGAERALPALPTDRNGFHRRILAPGEQDGREITDHVQRQRVERLGAVQA